MKKRALSYSISDGKYVYGFSFFFLQVLEMHFCFCDTLLKIVPIENGKNLSLRGNVLDIPQKKNDDLIS